MTSLLRRIQRDDLGPCIYFAGSISKVSGYGYGRFAGRNMPAHRAAYIASGRAIPPGYDVDHVCHSVDLDCIGGPSCQHRRCVNPTHLEAVTRAENLRRAAARITHCPQGHEYTDGNTRINGQGHKACVTCLRARDIERNRRRGMQPVRADFATHCARGHEYTSETLHVEISREGRQSRRCRICGRINAAAKRARRKSVAA